MFLDVIPPFTCESEFHIYTLFVFKILHNLEIDIVVHCILSVQVGVPYLIFSNSKNFTCIHLKLRWIPNVESRHYFGESWCNNNNILLK